MLFQNEVVHVLNRSRAFVVITSGNAANHSIVVGIVGERVLLSLLSYCYLFVIVMPVSVPCCRCYHVWHTLLAQDTFLVENLKNDHFNKKLLRNFLTNTGWLTNEKGSMFHGPDVSCDGVLPFLRIDSLPPDPKWPGYFLQIGFAGGLFIECLLSAGYNLICPKSCEWLFKKRGDQAQSWMSFLILNCVLKSSHQDILLEVAKASIWMHWTLSRQGVLPQLEPTAFCPAYF